MLTSALVRPRVGGGEIARGVASPARDAREGRPYGFPASRIVVAEHAADPK